jgi:phosphoribosylanthranilate isomerase
VGVFADQDAETINGIAEECGLDLVQLSGSEPWEMCAQLNRPVLKCTKVRQGQQGEEVLAEIGEGGLVLLDPYVGGSYGGAGVTLDWAVAGQVASRLPVMLAGGLTPENVAEAIHTVRPWAVDVSSGVETEGAKDVWKIRAFIEGTKGE